MEKEPTGGGREGERTKRQTRCPRMSQFQRRSAAVFAALWSPIQLRCYSFVDGVVVVNVETILGLDSG